MATVAETPRFIFRLPPELRADLESVAEQENRTLTNLIVYVLRRYLAERSARMARRDADRRRQVVGVAANRGASTAEIEDLKRESEEAERIAVQREEEFENLR